MKRNLCTLGLTLLSCVLFFVSCEKPIKENVKSGEVTQLSDSIIRLANGKTIKIENGYYIVEIPATRSRASSRIRIHPMYLYSKNHVWIDNTQVSWPGRCYLGVTDYAIQDIGSIVFVGQYHGVGEEVWDGDQFAWLESSFAVLDLFMPLTGMIEGYNRDLEQYPERIEDNPYETWIIEAVLYNLPEANELMNAGEYAVYILR